MTGCLHGRMTVRFPRSLQPGDRVGVTAPSSGVEAKFRPRFEVAVESLRDRGYDVVLGECLGTPSVVSAPKEARAAELVAMLTDPAIAAVVPPWGGEMAIDLLDVLDWDALAAAEPTWLDNVRRAKTGGKCACGKPNTTLVVFGASLAEAWGANGNCDEHATTPQVSPVAHTETLAVSA